MRATFLYSRLLSSENSSISSSYTATCMKDELLSDCEIAISFRPTRFWPTVPASRFQCKRDSFSDSCILFSLCENLFERTRRFNNHQNLSVHSVLLYGFRLFCNRNVLPRTSPLLWSWIATKRKPLRVCAKEHGQRRLHKTHYASLFAV